MPLLSGCLAWCEIALASHAGCVRVIICLSNREQRRHAASDFSSSTAYVPGPTASSSCCCRVRGSAGGCARSTLPRVAGPSCSEAVEPGSGSCSEPAGRSSGCVLHGGQIISGGNASASSKRAANRSAANASLRAVRARERTAQKCAALCRACGGAKRAWSTRAEGRRTAPQSARRRWHGPFRALKPVCNA